MDKLHVISWGNSEQTKLIREPRSPSDFVTNSYGESWDSFCEKSRGVPGSRTNESQLKKDNKFEIENAWAFT